MYTGLVFLQCELDTCGSVHDSIINNIRCEALNSNYHFSVWLWKADTSFHAMNLNTFNSHETLYTKIDKVTHTSNQKNILCNRIVFSLFNISMKMTTSPK